MADSAETVPTHDAVETVLDDAEEEENKEILAMKQRVEEMEREANKLRELQAAAEKQESASETGGDGSVSMETEDERAQADSRSIFVGNVDYSSTPEEIQQHFQACGVINRVTILCDKFTGHPKGFAYVEFADTEAVDTAVAMDNSLFRGRLIKRSVQIFTASTVAVDEVATVAAIEEAIGEAKAIALTVVVGVSFAAKQKRAAIIPPPSSLLTLMLARSLRQWTRSLTTATSNYPFAQVIIPPTPPTPPTPALLKGKGIMQHVRQNILSPEKQKLLFNLFSRHSPNCIQSGAVLRVTMNHAPNVFSGVVMSIRRRGPDTSFVIRNVVNRTGVEMQFFPASPHITDIEVIKKEGSGGGKAGRRARRAKLFYLRDSPEKMTNISQGVRGVSA
ncbi:hypothetical protein BDY19DRAFT_903561 [Irpex rosettiformis]|uniref:Uncharacterized protein n=1 Tax=Irpex rosettiformis TaxID=378272 RepID=A0ACB8UFJ7_9APHY|nr:hypothetical protein BDY19DRAFT_903561 [Irpex rosettiformis]